MPAATSSLSASQLEVPTSRPAALKNVKHMAPPTRIASAVVEHLLDDADLVGDLGAAQHDDERPRRVAAAAGRASRARAASAARPPPAGSGRRLRWKRAPDGRCRRRRSRTRRPAPPAGPRRRGRWPSPRRGSARSRAAAGSPGASAAAAASAAGPTQSSDGRTAAAEQLRQPRGHRRHAQLLDDLALGPPQMRDQHDRAVLLDEVARWSAGRRGCGCRRPPGRSRGAR